MMRFQNVLIVASNGQEASTALDFVEPLRQHSKAMVVLAGLVSWPSDESDLGHIRLSNRDLRRKLENSLKAEIETAVRQRRNSVSGVGVLVGTPFVSIIREVDRQKRDLVVKVADGARSLKSTLFGTTDLHLMRKCPIPVWIIKPTRSRLARRILVPIDVVDDEHIDLNKKILASAAELARADESELLVINAWSMPEEAFLRGHFKEQEMKSMLHEIRAEHRRRLDQVIDSSDLSDISFSTHLNKGDPGDVIPNLAISKDVQTIVMGTVARTSVAGFFIGNTAETILNQVNCSVLAIKPDGFDCPVKLN